ncbi:replicative DNA helicase, partial [Streptomyces diastaticus]
GPAAAPTPEGATMSIPQQHTDHPSTQNTPEEATDARLSASQPSHLTRVPPNDLDAERCVLGACMLTRDAIDEIVVDAKLRPQDFYRPAHETIYRAVLRLHAAGEPVDPVTLTRELDKRGDLGKVGGAPYLHDCVQFVPSAGNGQWYADIVKDLAKRRGLVTTGATITQLGYEEGDVTAAMDAASSALFAVADASAEEDYALVGDSLEADIDAIEARSRKGTGLDGLPTGFTDLDSLLNGLKGDQLIVLAGRPSMGKSTLAMDIIRACAIRSATPFPVGFFSLEMGRPEINERLLSATARVPLHHIRSGAMTDEDWNRISRNTSAVKQAPIYLDTSPNLTGMDIQAKARRLVQRHGVRLIVIDYLQLMKSGASTSRDRTRQEEVSDMSRNLKLLAKELHVPVIALSQLNRGPEQRADKKPMMSDLRESGSIEQDADIVMLLHREDAYEKESPRAGEADLIIAKHRNGPTATITVAFQGHYSRFTDMAND